MDGTNKENPMNFDQDDFAIQLVYLVAGAEPRIDIQHITNRLMGSESDHPLRVGGGHIGMVEDLISYAKQVSAYLRTRPDDQEFPGVFEYEVTESLGAWLADNWETVGLYSFNTELEARAAAFFT
jgi:hypothetical protein